MSYRVWVAIPSLSGQCFLLVDIWQIGRTVVTVAIPSLSGQCFLRWSASNWSSITDSRNPFFIRSMFLTATWASTWRSSATKSQSLLYQVNVSYWSSVRYRITLAVIVAIPSLSGQCFLRTVDLMSSDCRTLSRNPFFIRSMFLTWMTRRCNWWDLSTSRNPFFIRSMFLTVKRVRQCYTTDTKSRNPFFIRSMFLTRWWQYYSRRIDSSRNPFFIRSMFLTWLTWWYCHAVVI